MTARMLLACGALCLSAATAAAQSSAAMGGVPVRGDSAFDRMQSREAARAAEIRRRWLVSAHPAQPPAGPPQIFSGKILTPKLTVGKGTAAPKYVVSFKTGPSGLDSISAYFYSPGGSETLYVDYDTPYKARPVTHGTLKIQQPGFSYGGSAFDVYSPPGTWTLSYLYIYDLAGKATYYQPSQIATLFPGVTIQVTNHGKPDTTVPMVTAGKVLTPVVKRSSRSPLFEASLTVSDDFSGVRSAYFYVKPQAGDGIGRNNYLSAPLKSGKITVYVYLGPKPTKGVWMIGEYQVCDVARNCLSVSDATDIKALLGTTTFKVK